MWYMRNRNKNLNQNGTLSSDLPEFPTENNWIVIKLGIHVEPAEIINIWIVGNENHIFFI